MWIFDEDSLRFLAVNEAAVNLYGWSREEFLRMTVKSIRPPEEVPKLMKNLAGQRGSHAAFTGEWRHWKKDHTPFDVEVTISCIKFQGHDARLTMVTDVTERKRAEAALKQAHTQLEQRVLERTTELQASRDAFARSEEQFRQMAENVQEVFWLASTDLSRMFYVSPAFETIWGRKSANLYRTPRLWMEAVHPEDQKRVQAAFFRRRKSEAPLQAEYRIIRPDGTVRWIADRGALVQDSEGRAYRVAGVARDITERKETELALARANRALRVIGACNESLLRATSEAELFHSICRIVVEVGGYPMAWVGMAQHDARKTVQPVAYAGYVDHYLDNARITWADAPRGCGPAGTAIRTGEPCIIHDLLTSPHFAPWRQYVRKLGSLSAVGLPLIADGQRIGALTIFAFEADFFDTEELKLLTELANDVAFGVTTLRTRAVRERLEREVLEISEREQRRIGQDLHDGLGQRVGAARLTCAAVAHRLAKEKHAMGKAAARVERELALAIDETRQIARGLHPVKPGPDSLMAALHELAAGVAKMVGIRCRFICRQRVMVRDHAAATHLYRIAQEAVSNAARHGKPKHILLTLVQADDAVRLCVKDDGRGWPVAAKRRSGLGLSIMRYRASVIGASFAIASRHGRGTRVTCEWRPAIEESNAD